MARAVEFPVAVEAPGVERAVSRPPRWPGTLIAGGLIVGIFVLLAAVGPWVVPYDVEKFHRADALQGPSAKYWFGTDRYGRDIFSRVLVGSRTTMVMAVSGTALGLLVGVLIGVVSGYLGGLVDEALILLRSGTVPMAYPTVEPFAIFYGDELRYFANMNQLKKSMFRHHLCP